MIIKEKAGMLGHIDYDYLPKGIIYQKGLLKMINSIACEYGIRFNEILTDNGAVYRIWFRANGKKQRHKPL